VNTNIAVFLDRDGTIIEERHFISTPEEVILIPNSADAIRELNQLGIKIFVISNQSGIAHGYFTETDLLQMNERLLQLLKNENAFIDKIYYCPHKDENNCECRKPKPGMLKQAEKEFGIDLKKSFVIGDRFVDVDAGKNVGAKTILVETGYGEQSVKWGNENEQHADFTAQNLYEGIQYIKRLLDE